ncbi:hypothetical protein NEOLI_003365 [Neolecta irregularis DAH-3]|uniref:C2H2-type domain-containing protein n=1 Tax=Neolecta irregularis (strain DAH-3) TaxID=1198029 RepID=A0A1U7LVE0_NEOID|nr:hypothetical protein NEOLI_003365 [Neolecta irregularis DAH-3]|eukprot:OLL26481.1 hypothetical protein NEOLI_003365 [Neolecta irregularis DAH-3]
MSNRSASPNSTGFASPRMGYFSPAPTYSSTSREPSQEAPAKAIIDSANQPDDPSQFKRPRKKYNIKAKKGRENPFSLNCKLCGKLYKSRKPLKKHFFEHSKHWSPDGGCHGQSCTMFVARCLGTMLHSGSDVDIDIWCGFQPEATPNWGDVGGDLLEESMFDLPTGNGTD